MPLQFPLPTQPPPPLILDTAARYHVPPLWAAAVAWRESEWTFAHRTPDDGGSGGTSWGVFQIHDDTLARMANPWGHMAGSELLVPEVGTEAGCASLRWNLWRVLVHHGLVEPSLWGVAQYEAMPAALDSLPSPARRSILEHATAAFTAGDAGFLHWPYLADYYNEHGKPEMGPIKTQYVADVLAIMEHLEAMQKGAESGK